jgi:cytoplasmic iron level regulating protein YaaA (DUF328/UPF0246 family)
VLVVLSPAKSLDYESTPATRKFSEPRLLDQAEELVSVMADKSPRSLGRLMGISESLAELNFERFQNWERSSLSPTGGDFDADEVRPAVLAFDGDVYVGMETERFNQRDFTHAQKVIRILSGLYGVLRPLDLMLPYRLEMGTKLKTGRGRSLYEFWGDTITDMLNQDLAASPGRGVLVNLASNEYFKSVRTEHLDAPVVAPVFLDAKGDGDHRVVSFFAKKARGSMASWIVRERVASADDLSQFDGMGYRFDSDRSSPSSPTFIRRNEP